MKLKLEILGLGNALDEISKIVSIANHTNGTITLEDISAFLKCKKAISPFTYGDAKLSSSKLEVFNPNQNNPYLIISIF